MHKLLLICKYKPMRRLVFLYKFPRPTHWKFTIHILRFFFARLPLPHGAVRIVNHLNLFNEMNDPFLGHINPRHIGQKHPKRFDVDLGVAANKSVRHRFELLAFL